MSDQTQNEPQRESKERNRQSSAPRKFVFDFVEKQLKANESQESLKVPKNLQFLKSIPLIAKFNEPEDVKEEYVKICKNILNAYHEVRELLILDTLDSIKDTLKGFKIEKPTDCIKFLKMVTIKYHERVRELHQKGDLDKTSNEYERLLQKSELKIRDLIRNEQIYRLSFDQFMLKHEETERVFSQLQTKLQENKTTIENLKKEISRLTSMLQQKEDEIYSVIQEKDNYIRNFSSQQSKDTSRTECSTRRGNFKDKLTSLDFQTLKALLNHTRSISTEESRPTLNIDSLRMSGAYQKRKSKTPGIGADKSLRKSGTNLDSESSANKQIKLTGIEKDIQESLKDRIGAFTERKRDVSGDQGLNSSDRLLEWYSFVKHLKRPSSQLSYNRDGKKAKSPNKLNVRRDHSEGEENQPSHGKVGFYEDFSNFLTKTEPSGEYTSYMLTEKPDSKRKEDSGRKLNPKGGRSPVVSKSAKKKAEAKCSPRLEKPADFKNLIAHKKQTENVQKIYQIPAKGRKPLTEKKDNIKNNKISTSLANNIMKKNNENKPVAKKILH